MFRNGRKKLSSFWEYMSKIGSPWKWRQKKYVGFECCVKSSKSFLGALARQNFVAPTRPKKTFVWFQTAFAWKVKLLSNMFAWIQNSFFGSLICRKKQLTRILDDSWKSIVLVPQSTFVSKCKKFRQNLSDGIRVRQRVKVFRNGRKKLSSFWE